MKLGIYKHYKGNVYEVIGIAKHSEDLSEMVVYQSVVDGQMWVRSKEMFLEHVLIEGKKIPRFTFLTEDS